MVYTMLELRWREEWAEVCPALTPLWQGNEDPKKGSGLEYGYIDVRDEYRDDHTRWAGWWA